MASLAGDGGAARFDGRFCMRFGRGRRARGSLPRGNNFEDLLSALLARNPCIDVYETRIGTFKRFETTLEGAPGTPHP